MNPPFVTSSSYNNDNNNIAKLLKTNEYLQTIKRFLSILKSTTERYKKYSNDIRFLFFIDKLIIGMEILKESTISSLEVSEVSPEMIEIFSSAFDPIFDELSDLEEFIKESSITPMKNIEKKLDEFLLGPDFSKGKELMNSAENDFSECINELNKK